MTVREPTQFKRCGQLTKAVETREESPGRYWAAQRTCPSNNLNDTVFAVSLFAFRHPFALPPVIAQTEKFLEIIIN
ncbi:hypothetical protein CUMW_009760 [Citrus unshiu]|nr:hypothetical protein CUMW_009760 [Citrus unshiu]